MEPQLGDEKSALGILPSQLELIICAPTGQDAYLVAKTCEREGFSCATVKDFDALNARLQRDAGVILISEEALNQQSLEKFSHFLACQEPWSDIPVIVMTGTGEISINTFRLLKALAPSGNISLIERPFRAITLISSVQVALRARRRQYQVRELLESQARATMMRDEFISIASHELKTPLTSLKLQTQLSLRLEEREVGILSPRIRKLLDVTNAQVDRLIHLVEDMLDISRISSGKLAIRKSPFDLARLTLEVIDNFRLQLESVKCEIDVSGVQSVSGDWDRYRIEQVINNLVSNACRHSPGRPIRVYTALTNGHAELVVQDQGLGIAPKDQLRIFDRFERAVDSYSVGGLGLGLYICKQIMECHQGSIHVESNLGEGAKFVVRLPRASTVAGIA